MPSANPKETYGLQGAEIKLSIGNGGAGPTGILRCLSEDYLADRHKSFGIAWYQDISPDTLLQLKRNVIDVALVYDPEQAEMAVNEGFASHYTLIFYDHFIIIGPRSNTANLLATDTPEQAFIKIAEKGIESAQEAFLSRDDHSGTNEKEKSLWLKVGLTPWSGNCLWYAKYHAFPQEALVYADRHFLYTLTDYGTWQSSLSLIKNAELYIKGGDVLLNPCFALLRKNPSELALDFLAYLKSARGQNIIRNFGDDEYKHPFYTPASQPDFIE